MYQMVAVRKEMEFTKTMGEIVEVLKAIASTEYFSLQKRRKKFNEFEEHLQGFFELVNVEGLTHPFLSSSSEATNIVLITSEAGFLGKLNTLIVNTAIEEYKKGDLITVVGKQGARYIQEHGLKYSYLPGIDDNISYDKIIKLRDIIVTKFLDEKLGSTIIIYPHFVSFAAQEVKKMQILPGRFLFPEKAQFEPQSASGVFRPQLPHHKREIIIEPSINRSVEYLIKIWIEQIISFIFWESKLSEWASRVIHLERSSDEIKKEEKELKRLYFRLRHRISDKNIREIYASRLAIRQN